jgi:hypothetical protein
MAKQQQGVNSDKDLYSEESSNVHYALSYLTNAGIVKGTFDSAYVGDTFVVKLSQPVGEVREVHILIVKDPLRALEDTPSSDTHTCTMLVMRNPEDVRTYLSVSGKSLLGHMEDNVVMTHLPCIKMHLKHNDNSVTYELLSHELPKEYNDESDNVKTDMLMLACLKKYYAITGTSSGNSDERVLHLYVRRTADPMSVFGGEYIRVVYKRLLLGVPMKGTHYCVCKDRRLHITALSQTSYDKGRSNADDNFDAITTQQHVREEW